MLFIRVIANRGGRGAERRWYVEDLEQDRSEYISAVCVSWSRGKGYRRIGTIAWQVSISVQILISNQSRRIWLEKDEILEKSFVRFKRVGEMMERYSGSSIFLCKRILIIITDSSAINLLTLLTRD